MLLLGCLPLFKRVVGPVLVPREVYVASFAVYGGLFGPCRAFDCFLPIYPGIVPSECDGVIRRAGVSTNRSSRLPPRESTGGVLRPPSVISSTFSVKPNHLIYVRVFDGSLLDPRFVIVGTLCRREDFFGALRLHQLLGGRRPDLQLRAPRRHTLEERRKKRGGGGWIVRQTAVSTRGGRRERATRKQRWLAIESSHPTL